MIYLHFILKFFYSFSSGIRECILIWKKGPGIQDTKMPAPRQRWQVLKLLFLVTLIISHFCPRNNSSSE